MNLKAFFKYGRDAISGKDNREAITLKRATNIDELNRQANSGVFRCARPLIVNLVDYMQNGKRCIKFLTMENCGMGFVENVWQSLEIEQRGKLVLMAAENFAKYFNVEDKLKTIGFFTELNKSLSGGVYGEALTNPEDCKVIMSLEGLEKRSGISNLMTLAHEIQHVIDRIFEPDIPSYFWNNLGTEFNQYISHYIKDVNVKEKILYGLYYLNPIEKRARNYSDFIGYHFVQEFYDNLSPEEKSNSKNEINFNKNLENRIENYLNLNEEQIEEIYVFNEMLMHPEQYRFTDINDLDNRVTNSLRKFFTYDQRNNYDYSF